MQTIISGSLNLFGGIIKYSFYTGLILVVSGGAMAIYTKPDEASFNQFLKNKIEQSANNGSISGIVAAKVASTSVLKISNIQVKDLVFFKIGSVTLLGKDAHFVGAFQHWFE